MKNKQLVVLDTTKIPTLPSPSDFESYSRTANLMPVLSDDEERVLLELWQHQGNKEAVQILVLSHLRLVIKIVKNHRGYGLSSGDLAQEGTIGLMKAVQRFDASMGVRLAAYALRWIEAEIREFIFKNLRIVRLSNSSDMKKLFFGYRQTVQQLQKLNKNHHPIPAREIAEHMGLEENHIEMIKSYFQGADSSLELSGEDGHEERENSPLLLEILQDPEQQTPENQLIVYDESVNAKKELQKALSELNEREQDIISKRYLSEPAIGLAEIGSLWSISAERVRQIESSAMKKLKNKMNKEYEQ